MASHPILHPCTPSLHPITSKRHVRSLPACRFGASADAQSPHTRSTDTPAPLPPPLTPPGAQFYTFHIPYTLPAVHDAPALFAIRAVFRYSPPPEFPPGGPCAANYADNDDLIISVLPAP